MCAEQVVIAGVGVVGVFQEWAVLVEVAVAEVVTGVVCWEAEAAPDTVTEVTDTAQPDLPAMSAVCLIGFSDQVLSGSSKIPTCSPLASSPQGGWTTGESSLLEQYPLTVWCPLCHLCYRLLPIACVLFVGNRLGLLDPPSACSALHISCPLRSGLAFMLRRSA